MLRGNPPPPNIRFFLFLSITFPSLFKKNSEISGGGGGLNPLNPPPPLNTPLVAHIVYQPIQMLPLLPPLERSYTTHNSTNTAANVEKVRRLQDSQYQLPVPAISGLTSGRSRWDDYKTATKVTCHECVVQLLKCCD